MAARQGRLNDLALLYSRLALGAYFALAGWGKLKSGFFAFAGAEFFVNARPAWLPPPLHTAYGYALPYVEIAAGLLLALGFYARQAALVIALLLTSFTVALGVKGQGGPFEKNLVFLGLALLLAIAGPGRFALRRSP